MKIFLIHNYYQQFGGEDHVFAAESCLLEKHGHRIFHYTVHNDCIKKLNALKLACSTLWNKTIAHELLGVIRKIRPDVIHFNNTFPLISPAAYYVAKAEGLPVVQTLHNYRLLCPNALFLRNGHVCEDCMGKFVPFPGILHACYRESRVATTVTVVMLSLHRVLRTYSQMVDVYITLTEFSRNKFIEGGLPAEKVLMKPNYIDTDKLRRKSEITTNIYALFIGRLSPEKGINILLAAWKHLGNKLPLKIVGDGPIKSIVAKSAKMSSSVEWLGPKSREDVLDLMKDAFVLILPSIWYEGLPMTIIEAYSVGLPVIASNLGSMSSVIEHGHTGLHFRPGDPKDLAEKVNWAINNPKELTQMRLEARKEYESKYTAEINYKKLMDIYKTAIERARMKK